MRTIIFAIPDSLGVSARLIDEATGRVLEDVQRVEFDELVPLMRWGGTLHFIERSGKEPEDVVFRTAA
tara:strand:+ start:21598 stop:21801 length:204 start_codon:yes stop_codon:yes gene_type:complete